MECKSSDYVINYHDQSQASNHQNAIIRRTVLSLHGIYQSMAVVDDVESANVLFGLGNLGLRATAKRGIYEFFIPFFIYLAMFGCCFF
jgi:hypothetical protein